MSNRQRKAAPTDMWLAILVLGSLFGFSEVVLNGAIRAAGLPYRAGILTGVGVGLMAIAVAMFRKPLMLVGIATVAMLGKQLVVPILHVALTCKANSCLAVLLEGLALAGTVTLVGRRLERGLGVRIVGAASAALVASGAFHYLGIRLAPCNYLLSFNRPGGLLAFLSTEGLSWAIASALIFPVGYRLGEWLREGAPALRARQPLTYYATNAILVVGSWVASAAAISAGF